MWWGGELMPAIIDFLSREQADIVLLQEVHDGHAKHLSEQRRSMDVLREKLNYPYENYAHAADYQTREGIVPSGNAVLSRFPIVNSQKHFLVEALQAVYDDDDPKNWPILPRILQQVELDAEGVTLNVFNIHCVWDLDGDNYSPQRQKMAEDVKRYVKGLDHVILAGDTNAKASNQAMKDIETVLTSVFKDELKTTFNMKRKNEVGYASAPVDLMFVSSDIKVLSKALPQVDISDHLPIVAELDIN